MNYAKVIKDGNVIFIEDAQNFAFFELDPRDADLPDGVIKLSDLKYTKIIDDE